MHRLRAQGPWARRDPSLRRRRRRPQNTAGYFGASTLNHALNTQQLLASHHNMMATTAYGLAGPFINSQLASCLANGLGSLCGPSAASPAVPVPGRGSFSGASGYSGSSGASGTSGTTSPSGSLGSETVACANCDEGAVVVASCTSCKEALCEGCAQAHQRVRLTKAHQLVRLEETVGGQDRAVNLKLLRETEMGLNEMQDLLNDSQQMVETIQLKTNRIGGEIQHMCRTLVAAIEDRERELLGRLEKVRLLKEKSMGIHMETVRCLLVRFQRLSESLRDTLQRGTALDLLHIREKAAVELLQLRAARANVLPGRFPEDDDVTFVAPEPTVLRAVASMGAVTSSSFAHATVASGEGLSHATQGQCSSFTVQVKNHLGESVVLTSEHLEGVAIGPDGIALRCTVEDRGHGTYEMGYCPLAAGTHALHVTLRGRHVMGSPFQVAVTSSLTADHSRPHPTTFGSEGSDDGKLLRPWGICSDSEGRLVVADRSNHRIQVFSEMGEFLLKFGEYGPEEGQFDKPAGVACDTIDRIIVADKDNHRIQIFNAQGRFIMKFGAFGSKAGQFKYPWDVATNSRNQIVVSDTKNHRIQLFSSEGHFLRKYGFENFPPMVKHFDNPRGICFTKGGFVCVTDFNKHRLLVVDPEFRSARFLGEEGSGRKQFYRPQGVAVDTNGHILVADSRNNRIQIFEPSGDFVREIGTPFINLSYPSGMCVTREGKIAVVDFGNSRIVLI